MRIFVAMIVIVVGAGGALGEPWTGYRGAAHDGVSNERGTPIRWDVTTGENVAWIAPLPLPGAVAGGGHASPIVLDDRVVVTAVVEGGKPATVCFDRKTGEQVWRDVIELPGAAGGTATATCDDATIYAWHSPGAIAAYDFDGKRRWSKSLGAPPEGEAVGDGPSAVLHEDLLINLATVGAPGSAPGKSELAAVALDKRTGDVVWRTPFDGAGANGGSTASPVLIRSEGRTELIVVVPGYVVSLNPQSGREYWRCGGLGDRIAASPAVSGQTIVAVSAGGGPMIAVKPPGAGRRGDVADTHRMWRLERTEATSSSPVIVGDAVFMVSESGEVACVERVSGADVWRRALNVPGPVRAPLIYANLWLYVVDAGGEVHVIGANRKYKPIGGGVLGEGESASSAPSFSDGQMFIRTDKRLYGVGVRRAT